MKTSILSLFRRATALTGLLLFSFHGVASSELPAVESLMSSDLVFESESEPESVASQGIENTNLLLIRKVESLQQEMQELRGRIEELQYGLDKANQHQRDLYLDLDRRLREGGLAKLGMLPATQGTEQVVEDASTKVLQPTHAVNHFQFDVGPQVFEKESNFQKAPHENETFRYQKAYELIQNKDYASALHAFEQFIEDYPNGEHVPNAQYWLGEIHLAKGALEEATDAFEAVYDSAPEHPKAADALLKLGVVAYTADQKPKAIQLFNQVKSQYPNTTSARLAEAKLKQIRQAAYQDKS